MISIYMRNKVWNELCGVAGNIKDSRGDMKEYFLFYPRGRKLVNNVITDMVEVPVRIIKSTSPSGPIFRWQIAEDERKSYYPPTIEQLTNTGRAIIQRHLEITLHYTFWMGTEYDKEGLVLFTLISGLMNTTIPYTRHIM